MAGQKEANLILLKSTKEKYEIDLITVILKENNIPYEIKNETIDGHMKIVTGSFFYEIKIYIREIDFEKAKELLEPFMNI